MHKKPAMLATFAAILFATVSDAEARRMRIPGIAFVTDGPYVTEVAPLPDTAQISPDGEQWDLGWSHERFTVFGMPLWGTTDGAYVLYKEAPDGWNTIPLEAADIAEIEKMLGQPLAGQSPVSAFSVFWGWIIVLPLILLGIAGKFAGRNAGSGEDYETSGSPVRQAAGRSRDPEVRQAPAARPSSANGHRTTFGRR